MPNQINPNSLTNVFNRIDTNSDRSIDADEVGKVAEKAGISGRGFIGRLKMKGIKSQFFDNFDTNDNRRVSLDEFKRNGKNLLPQSESSGVSLARGIQGFATTTFDKMDINRDTKLNHKEVEDFVRGQLENADVSMAATKADIAGRLAVQLLDANGDHSISRDEMQELVHDIIQQLEES